MSSPDIAGILDNSRELDRLRKEQEEVLLEINKMHKKLQATPEVVERPGDTSLSRLKILYTQAKDLSESEVSVSTILLSQLDSLLPSGPTAQQRRRIEGSDQKKKRMKNDSEIPRLSPSMRSQLEACANMKGEQVAARVTGDNAEKDEWFVVKVIHFDRETKEFEVLDEEPGDDEEGEDKGSTSFPCHVLFPSPKETILPMLRTSLLGDMCWLFIQEQLPFTRRLLLVPLESYLLEFDDDEEDGALPQRVVPFHKVVPLPEGHRQ